MTHVECVLFVKKLWKLSDGDWRNKKVYSINLHVGKSFTTSSMKERPKKTFTICCTEVGLFLEKWRKRDQYAAIPQKTNSDIKNNK